MFKHISITAGIHVSANFAGRASAFERLVAAHCLGNNVGCLKISP